LLVSLERLTKPSSKGAEFIGVFKTKNGVMKELLTSTLSPELLWAFSSTTEDVELRSRLYLRFGVAATLRVLAKKYPGGIKSELERRKLMTDENNLPKEDHMEEIAHELEKLMEAL
jgi:intracellular multiplication protein IcmB